MNVNPLTRRCLLPTRSERVRRDLGDIAQNAGRSVANAVLAGPYLIGKCAGFEVTFVPSYHRQRLALRALAQEQRLLMQERAPAAEERKQASPSISALEAVPEPPALRHPEPDADRVEQIRRELQAGARPVDASNPRPMGILTSPMVEEALALMERGDVVSLIGGLPPLADYLSLEEDDSRDRPDDPRLRVLVAFTDVGLRRLYEYGSRTFAMELRVPDDYVVDPGEDRMNIGGFVNRLREFIDPLRADGLDKRIPYACGKDHCSLVTYIRDKGREVLVVSDGMTLSDIAITRIARMYRDIPVVVPLGGFQASMRGCHVAAVKSAILLAGRRRDQEGTPGEYLMPDPIGTMMCRQVAMPDYFRRDLCPPDAQIVFIHQFPELVVFAESSTYVAHNAGFELDVPLAGSQLGATVRNVLARHTYLCTRPSGKPTVLHGMRSGAIGYGEIAQIEGCNRLIAQKVAKWSTQDATEFAQNAKTILRRPGGAQPQPSPEGYS